MKHFLCDLLRIVGLRDRLRCPSCKAVGTWKPHGGLLDRGDTRKVKRWLCKYCGFYRGPEGQMQCRPNKHSGVWEFDTVEGALLTPKEVVYRHYVGISPWPWRG